MTYGLPSLSKITPLGSFLYPPGSSLISPPDGLIGDRSFDDDDFGAAD